MGYTDGQSDVRAPRGIVKLGGATKDGTVPADDSFTVITGWTRFSVNNNAFSAADTFSIEFVASALPANRNAIWFANQVDMYVEIFAGFPDDPTDGNYDSSDLLSLIYGQVDSIDWDPENGLIAVSGRDLTRFFIDTKTTSKWPNLTASQIATQLATEHGLTPVVTPTTVKAGVYYQIDYVELTDDRTEWDILCYLAQSSNSRVYVKGTSLYFEPLPDSTSEPFVPPWPVEFEIDDAGGPLQANVMHPRFSRSLTVSRGIQVVVRSWNPAQGKAFNVSYPANKVATLRPGQSSPVAQVYRFNRPGKTQEQAQIIAQQLYEQIIQHEMQLEFDAPADSDLDITRYILVSGTGTSYDQIYYPDSIERTLDVRGGYVMSVHAKNHSPDSQAAV